MNDMDERMRILEMLDNGQINAEQALTLIQALEEAAEPAAAEPTVDEQAAPDEAVYAATLLAPPAQDEVAQPDAPTRQEETVGTSTANSQAESVQPEVVPQAQPPDFTKWRRFWVVPFWVGAGLAVLGGLLMNWALATSGSIGFWFFCATIPMLLGVLVVVLAWQSRTAHWLHLRVHQKPGEKPQHIVISFPLPMRITLWFVRTFRYRMPQLQQANLDELLQAVDETTSPENPLYIEVDEGEDGEQVQIYIG